MIDRLQLMEFQSKVNALLDPMAKITEAPERLMSKGTISFNISSKETEYLGETNVHVKDALVNEINRIALETVQQIATFNSSYSTFWFNP